MCQGGLLGHQNLNFPSFLSFFGALGGVIFDGAGLFGVDLISTTYVLVEQFFFGEELVDEFAFVQHPLGEGADDADDPGEQALHGLVLEEHVAREQLGQDAAQTPHVDLVVVLAADDDLGRPVAAALDVRAQVVVDVATRPEIDDLHLRLRVALYQDVLRLQVAVDQLQTVDVLQAPQDLQSYPLQATYCEVFFRFLFLVELVVIVKIIFQQFSNYEEMLVMVEVVINA